MSRPREHWGEVCPFCGRNMINELNERLIDGAEFELECQGCGNNWHVDVQMVPEFALTDARDYRKYEQERIDRILKGRR